MGKGQRARESRAGKREEMQKIAAKKRRKERIGKVIGICSGVIVALAIVAVVVYSSIASTGFFLRNTVAMKTDNYKVDNAMMAYYVQNQYYSFTNTYSEYLSMYGLDTSKSLKSQEYGDGTWFDYFLEQAKTQVKDLLLCAEKAKADGMTLDEEDKKTIDESMNTFKTYADNNKITLDQYFSSVFAQGVKEADVRRAIELSTLGAKYYSKYSDSLEYTDEDLQKYFDEHKENYVKADYMSYSFTASIASDATDAEKDAAKADAKAKAEKLTASTSVDEFKTNLETYLKDKHTAEYTEEETAEGEEKLTKEEKIAQEVATDMTNASATKYYTAEEDDDVGLWMFNAERKAGDTYLDLPADDAKTFTYTAYVLVNTQYFDQYETVDARHILFTAETYENAEGALKKANEVLAKYNEGEKTEESFEKLAKENSEDANVENNGGLYEGITKNTANYPQEFIDWCYDPARVTGDVGVIETESGAHIMYYSGKGGVAWKEAATLDKNADDIEAHLDEIEKSHPVTSNDSKMDNIDL